MFKNLKERFLGNKSVEKVKNSVGNAPRLLSMIFGAIAMSTAGLAHASHDGSAVFDKVDGYRLGDPSHRNNGKIELDEYLAALNSLNRADLESFADHVYIKGGLDDSSKEYINSEMNRINLRIAYGQGTSERERLFIQTFGRIADQTNYCDSNKQNPKKITLDKKPGPQTRCIISSYRTGRYDDFLDVKKPSKIRTPGTFIVQSSPNVLLASSRHSGTRGLSPKTIIPGVRPKAMLPTGWHNDFLKSRQQESQTVFQKTDVPEVSIPLKRRVSSSHLAKVEKKAPERKVNETGEARMNREMTELAGVLNEIFAGRFNTELRQIKDLTKLRTLGKSLDYVATSITDSNGSVKIFTDHPDYRAGKLAKFRVELWHKGDTLKFSGVKQLVSYFKSNNDELSSMYALRDNVDSTYDSQVQAILEHPEIDSSILSHLSKNNPDINGFRDALFGQLDRLSSQKQVSVLFALGRVYSYPGINLVTTNPIKEKDWFGGDLIVGHEVKVGGKVFARIANDSNRVDYSV